VSKLLTTFCAVSVLSAACGSDSGTPADGGTSTDAVMLADAAANADGTGLAADSGTAGSDGAAPDAGVASSDGASGSDGAASPDVAGTDVNLMSGFVRGTIAGEVLDYGALVGAVESMPMAGGTYLQIGGHKALNGTDYWAITVPNVVGTYACNDGMHPFTGVGFTRSEGGPIPNMYSSAGKGSCSITLTAAAAKAGDVAKGTFTATVISLYKATQMLDVTDGAFEAPRAQ
jgi:hypothetical protein